MRLIHSLLTITAIVLATRTLQAAETAPGHGTYVDVHLHFSNQSGFQKPSGDGIRERYRPRGRRPIGRPFRGSGGGRAFVNTFTDKDFISCADNMIAKMNQYGIQKAVVMPQPRLSGQPGFYGYRQILPALRKYPGRLYLGGGGGKLNSMIHSTDPAKVTDAVRAEFTKEAEAIVKAGARAFGELAALHVSLQPKHVYEEVSPDHPLLLLLANIAAKHGIPVDIHMEAVEKDIRTPDNLRKISTKNPSTIKANIPAFERLLKHNRKANIVWQHIGWDNLGQMTITLLRRMLKDHPNLYLGFKVEERPYKIGTRKPMPNRMVTHDYKLKSDWLQFFKDEPDRFLLACDQFVGIPGKTIRAPGYLEETMTTIKQLPKEVLLKVARDNAVKLYGLK